MNAADLLPLSRGPTDVVFGEHKEFYAAHFASLNSAARLYGKKHYRDAYICLLNSIENYLKHVFLRWAVTDVMTKRSSGMTVVYKPYGPYDPRGFSHNLVSLGVNLQRGINEVNGNGTFVALQSRLPSASKGAAHDSFGAHYVNLRYRDPSYVRKSDGLTLSVFCKGEYEQILPVYIEVKKSILKDLNEPPQVGSSWWSWSSLLRRRP